MIINYLRGFQEKICVTDETEFLQPANSVRLFDHYYHLYDSSMVVRWKIKEKAVQVFA